MDKQKADILTDNVSKIIDRFKLNDEFWNELKESKIFPTEYIEYMKNDTEADDIKKKNLIIDLTRRARCSYEKFSNILQNNFNCDILDQYIQKEDAYPINSDNPGYCLIINNDEFSTCNTRDGSEKDVEKFRSLFINLNYDVIIKRNLVKEDFLNFLRKKSVDPKLKKHDIFVTIVMSHGVSEKVITSDDKLVSYNQILDFFTDENCANLINKPKIFIFNCCRSPNDPRLPIEKSVSEDDTMILDTTSVNTFSDMLIIFSTLNYYLSVRDPESGTFFTNAFFAAMKNNPGDDVCTLVTKANVILNDMVKNNEKNQLEKRQTIEQRTLGVKKNVYFSKLESRKKHAVDGERQKER